MKKLSLSSTLSNVHVWGVLALAVGFEVAGGIFMEQAKGFQNMNAAILAALCVQVCVVSTTLLLVHLDLSIGWALYTALEYLGIQTWGMFVLGESCPPWKMRGLALCFLGVLILATTDDDDEEDEDTIIYVFADQNATD